MFPDIEDFERALKAHGLTSRDLDQLNLDFSEHLGFFAIESTPSGVFSAV
jgi:hypothetical protein